MINAIIVDDEKLAIRVLSELLKVHKNVEIVGTYTNPIDAIKDLENTKPNVLFLDIEMGKYNGIDMADKFLCSQCNIDIIFVTAYSEYAIEAFELNAIDYLLKPVTPARLSKAMERISVQDVEEKTTQKITIQSLGNFQLLDENQTAISWRTEKSKELFAYLWAHQDQVILRSVLVETLFPNRDAEKANTLFSTTLYQTRKTATEYLDKNFLSQANSGYKFDAKIESDMAQLNRIIDAEKYTVEAFDDVQKLYLSHFLEYEDYTWKDSLSSRIQAKVKKFVSNIYESIKSETDLLQTQERILTFLYQLDRLDDFIYEDMIKFYKNTNQTNKLKKFKQEHNEYLEKELGITA